MSDPQEDKAVGLDVAETLPRDRAVLPFLLAAVLVGFTAQQLLKFVLVSGPETNAAARPSNVVSRVDDVAG